MNLENVNKPKDLYLYMKNNIKYGFVSKVDNKIHVRSKDAFYDEELEKGYFLQTPEELYESGYGLCFDQVLFAKKWLKEHNYSVQAYYSPYHNHTFLAYKDREINRFVLFERTLGELNGLNNFYGLTSLLDYYRIVQAVYSNGKIKPDDVEIYMYDDEPYGANFSEVYNIKNKEAVYVKIK